MVTLAAGKVSSFDQALSRWAGSPWASRLVRSCSDDAVQDAALAVLELERQGRLCLEDPSSPDALDRRLGGYLRTCVARTQGRTRKREGRLVPLPEGDHDSLALAPDAERVLEARRQLEQLPCSDDEVRLLAHQELLDEDDELLAARLGVTLNTLQQRRSRARKKLGLR